MERLLIAAVPTGRLRSPPRPLKAGHVSAPDAPGAGVDPRDSKRPPCFHLPLWGRGWAMEGIAQLLTTIAERAFYYAVLGLVFCGLLMIGNYLGFSIPQSVLEWLNVAFALCLAIAVMEFGRRVIASVQGRAEVSRAEKEEHNQALRNVAALYREEALTLRALLGANAPTRFTVAPLSPLSPLMDKGVLRVVREAGALSYICEVHPAILERKADVLRVLPTRELEGG